MYFPIPIIMAFLLYPLIAAFDCGISEYFFPTKVNNESAGHHFKISNGDQVENNAKYPWMAAFFRNDKECCPNINFCYCCTASIIGPRHLTLAAHCFYSERIKRMLSKEEALEHSQIRLGNVNYLSVKTIKPTICQIMVHPEFNFNTLSNDIAIIELAYPLNFSEQIRPICLAKEFNETKKYGTNGLNSTLYGNGMTIAGWGHQHEAIYNDESQEDYRQPDSNPEILREGRAHSISLDECKIKTGQEMSSSVGEKIICMGIGRQNAEKGDSGGPAFLLMELTNGNETQKLNMQIGLTSFEFSHNSREKRPPVIYTRISAFCDWIEESTSGEIECS